jgi:membrane protease subunit (stomatin/prohibitin family)
MAVIDLVKWDGSPHLLAWKFPSSELATWTQLVVNETQEAFVVHGGVYDGPFQAGRHSLDTENLPVLRGAMGLPFGGSSPFTAEVWFVNKTIKMNMKWGTPDPIFIQDPQYKIMVPVRAYGQYGIQVTESKKFLLKFVGTLIQFTSDVVNEYFNGILLTKIRSSISDYFVNKNFSILDIHSHINDLSTDIQTAIFPIFQDFGIGLSHFYVQSVNVPDNDPAVMSLRSALAKKAEMGILGFNYHQERSFNVLQAAAESTGPAGTMMDAGLGMAMGIGMGGQMSQVLAQSVNAPLSQHNQKIDSIGSVSGSDGEKSASDYKQTLELLRGYAQLKSDGLLSEEEFQALKKKLLGV